MAKYYQAEQFALPIPRDNVRAPLVLEGEILEEVKVKRDTKTIPLFGDETKEKDYNNGQ